MKYGTMNQINVDVFQGLRGSKVSALVVLLEWDTIKHWQSALQYVLQTNNQLTESAYAQKAIP